MQDLIIIGLIIGVAIPVSLWVLDKTVKLVILLVLFAGLAYFLLPYLVGMGIPIPDFIQDLLNHKFILSVNLVKRCVLI